MPGLGYAQQWKVVTFLTQNVTTAPRKWGSVIALLNTPVYTDLLISPPARLRLLKASFASRVLIGASALECAEPRAAGRSEKQPAPLPQGTICPSDSAASRRRDQGIQPSALQGVHVKREGSTGTQTTSGNLCLHIGLRARYYVKHLKANVNYTFEVNQ